MTNRPGLFPTVSDALECLPAWLCLGGACWSAGASFLMLVQARWPELAFYMVASIGFAFAARSLQREKTDA